MKTAGNRVLMLLENAHYRRDTRVRREAEALVAAGCEVTVICPADKGEPRREVIDGVHIRRFLLPATGNGLWGYLGEYGYALAAAFVLSFSVMFRRGFDVIHAHNPPDLFVLIALFYRVLGKRFIFDHHDLAPEMYYARFGGQGSRLVYRALRWFEWLSCRAADHVIATNESYKAIERQRDGVPASRITVVRNGPKPEQFLAARPDEELRRRAGTIIGFLGVIGFQDGVDHLLRALRHLIDDLGRTGFLCLVMGDGDALESLRRLARTLELEAHVRFTGYVTGEEMLRYLASADLFVDPDPSNPYNDRCTMIKMMEYMALGKPIVAYDLPEHRVTAGDAALYARGNDALDFARKIAQLMDDPERCDKMGRIGRERIEQGLAWPYQEAKLLDAYEKTGLRVCRRRPGFPEPAAAAPATATESLVSG